MMANSGDQMSYQSGYHYFNDYNYNLIEPCMDQKNTNIEVVVGPYVHSIICILGLVGNGLVIVTYAFDVYPPNVAVADLLFVASLPLIVYNELSSSVGPIFFSSMNLYGCLAIVQARRSFRLRSLRYSRLICGTVWSSALLLSFPTFYFYHMLYFTDKNVMTNT
ncbi:LOW QUALITY PROTEIN: C-C chemokine receptor type 6a [Spinachia spinachia]